MTLEVLRGSLLTFLLLNVLRVAGERTQFCALYTAFSSASGHLLLCAIELLVKRLICVLSNAQKLTIARVRKRSNDLRTIVAD